MSDVVQDGSLESAVSAMPDIDALERAMGVQPAPRDDSGRYARTTPEMPAEALKEETKEPAKTEDVKAEDVEQTEDEIELPPEKEGEAPKRLKLNEVLEKYTKAEQLEAELTKLKSDPKLMPADAEQYVSRAIQEAQNYAAQIEQWQRLNRPTPPDETLLDSRGKTQEQYANNAYLYNAQKQNFDALTQAQLAAEQERRAVLTRANQQHEAVRASTIERNKAVLFKEVPELADKKAADRFKADLVKHFGRLGMSEELINSVDHPVFYVLAHKALQAAARDEKEAQVAKIVKAKPKLIAGSARQSQSPSQRRSAEGMSRLQQNPSDMDAAVAALDGLL